MSNLRQMSIFVTVVESGTFSAAAERLNVSAVAVSKQIASLEKKCQQVLFNRSTRTMALTDFAKQYYQLCKKTLKSMEEAEHLIASQSEQIQGTLRIHAIPFFTGHFIFPMLNKITNQHPQLKFELTIGDNIPNIVEEGIDLLIGYDSTRVGAKQNLRCCPLFETEYTLAASPLYIKEAGMPKCKEDLYNHRFIHDGNLPQPFTLSFLDGEVLEGLNTVLTIGDSRLMSLAALKHLGIAHIGKRTIFPELIIGDLVEILPNSLDKKINFSAFYKYSEIEQPKIKIFLKFLVESITRRREVISTAVMTNTYISPYNK